nr:hypothetical protein CFP56_74515 [Quercus suber]
MGNASGDGRWVFFFLHHLALLADTKASERGGQVKMACHGGFHIAPLMWYQVSLFLRCRVPSQEDMECTRGRLSDSSKKEKKSENSHSRPKRAFTLLSSFPKKASPVFCLPASQHLLV